MKSMTRGWVAAAIVLLVGIAVAWAQRWHDDDGPAPPEVKMPPEVRLRDTVTPVQPQTGITRRGEWRDAVGRLQGDLVVETEALAMVFASRLGRVLVYAKTEPTQSRAALLPTALRGKQTSVTVTRIAQSTNSAPTVLADFAAGTERFSVAFSFTSDRILVISPQEGMHGISLLAPMEFALVPSFVGDDLIYDPQNYLGAKTLSVVSEHALLGLLSGENSMLVMTWQNDAPPVRLTLGASGSGTRGITAADLGGSGAVSLAVLEAPGIWHREPLKPDFLERDVAIAWQPPFPALWLTQLYEDEVKTTFEFRDHRDKTWRGGVGYYTYPAWFRDGKAMFSLGKKIPPGGEAIIYFLERTEGTPSRVLSPTDVVKYRLTGDVRARLLDVEGRPAWYPERPNAVLGAATCATTDALKAIFDSGQEVEKQATVKGGVEDMYFYLEHMFERDARFYPFAKDMISYLDAQEKEQPELRPFLRDMRATAEEIVATYDNARDTIRDMNYAHELGDRTIALAAAKRPDNPQHMVELKQDWTGMGGALEELARREHSLTRKLYQQAGYESATIPGATAIAEEVRQRTWQCLQKPESYEIWANY